MRTPQATKTAVPGHWGGAETKVHGMEICTFFLSCCRCLSLHVPHARRQAMIGAQYLSILKRWGQKQIDILRHSNGLKLRMQIQSAWSVYWRILDGWWPTTTLCCIGWYTSDETITGTSEIMTPSWHAGAAVMGHHMIAGGGRSGESPDRSLVDLTTGARYLQRWWSTLSKPESDGAVN